MSERLSSFREFRERMNERILEADNLEVKRFFALDARTYEDGALEASTKELLGLVASMVLRCDDCVAYHLVRCRENGRTDEELFEAFAVALIVGGSIVIPHLRRAVDLLDELSGSGSGRDGDDSSGRRSGRTRATGGERADSDGPRSTSDGDHPRSGGK